MARIKKVTSKDGTVDYIEHVPNVTHKICSLYPRIIHLETKSVPACTEETSPEVSGVVGGVKYSFVEVPPKCSRVFIGGGKNDKWEVRLDVSAYDNARDMIGYVFSDQTDEPTPSPRSRELEGRGLFVPVGDVPTVAEIEAAKAKQLEFFHAVCEKAQSDWATTHKMTEIKDLQLIAARELGKRFGNKYEWVSGEYSLTKKSEAEVLAEAIGKLIASQQQAPAPVAAAAQRK